MLLPLISLTVTLALGDGLPTTAPRSVAMSADRLATVDRVVKRGITAGAYPGAAVVVGRRGFAVWQKGFGKLGWTTSSAAVDPMTSVYDLASLTKVIGLTTAAMVLYDEGKLPLEKLITRRYTLDQINEALDDLEHKRVGRPLIEIDPSLGAN